MTTQPNWLVLDIETRGGRPEDGARFVRENWWPTESWVPETIGKRFKEAIADQEKRMGLLDSAEIATVQLKSASAAVVLHTFYDQEPALVAGGGQTGFKTEADMLAALRGLLEGMTDVGTTLVGWNIKGFDLRRLRHRYVKQGLNVPKTLRVSADVFDMMDEYARHWSVDRVPFVKLEVALEVFGLPNHKREFDGAQVDEAIRAGQYDKVLAYAWKDIEQETELFLRMTGQSGGLK